MLVALFIIIAFILGALTVLALLFFRDRALIEALDWTRGQLAEAQVRADRLAEALAAHEGIPLVLPSQSELRPLEPSPGFFDHFRTPALATNPTAVKKETKNAS